MLPRIDKNSFWQSLFAADSVAVIGASDIPGSWGGNTMRALLASTRTGVKRQVYAVNPRITEILGLTSYRSILDIPNPVELAIIVVPVGIVPTVLRECVQKKVKAALIISAGFAEADEAGAQLEDELVEIARQGGLHFVGPNCAGHADAYSKLDSVGFAERMRGIKPGALAVLSQSGFMGARIVTAMLSKGIGFSKYVSTGNEADLHLEDYIEFLAQDDNTRIIAAYIEGLREGRRFFQLAKAITAKKPIVIIKAGGTKEAKRAARSHSGALAGSDVIYDVAFRQAGVIRVEDDDELCDMVVALMNQPLPQGNRIGILTAGGGLGVVATEACEKEGLVIASLSQSSLEKLNALLPSRWSHRNPIDTVGMVRGVNIWPGITTILSCLEIVMEDKSIDAIVLLIPPIFNIALASDNLSHEQLRAIEMKNDETVEMLSQRMKEYRKPLLIVETMPGVETSDSFDKRQLPAYPNPRRAAKVIRRLTWYREYLNNRESQGF